jgi:hypothetical protein
MTFRQGLFAWSGLAMIDALLIALAAKATASVVRHKNQ